MQWLSPTLLAIQVISALVIVVLVLLQQGKGSEMGAAFGSGSAGSLFGASGAANFLSRSTKWAAVIFFVTTGGLAYIAHHPHNRGFDGGVMQGFKSAPAKAPEAPAVPAAASSVPSVPTAPAKSGAAGQSSTAPAGSASSVPSAGAAAAPSAGATVDASTAAKSSASDSVPSIGAPAASGKAGAQPSDEAKSASTTSDASHKSGADSAGAKQLDSNKK
ncbi:MAG TPA: preprotein translocase subunit SecG [Burkholderiaceae bacterium]|nr:preprotein translocase subunit SecG [Burkholderiaceae bacterium]